MPIPEDQRQNYELFRDCLATALLEKISEPQNKPRRRTKVKPKKKTIVSPPPSYAETIQNDEDSNSDNGQNADLPGQATKLHTVLKEDDTDKNPTIPDDDLADFTDYIATETFAYLPAELKTIDYHDFIASPSLQSRYVLPLTGADIATHLPLLDPSIGDSLTAYGITSEDTQGIDEFLAPVLTSFLTLLGTAPPPPSSTRDDVDGCEICGRDWINLSYHHLIPRFVHAKAVKRGWHRECDLQNVAWLCGACHRFVHRFACHEDLARRFYTVELLLAEEEVKRWAQWVGRLRWKGR
ncbi:YisB protein [Xylariaceae sp. AK1471]|nr:YisB protein [Xylariaceae sp. AK1471]